MSHEIYRVVVEDLESSWSVRFNFKGSSSRENTSEIANELLDLADDWLDYCRAALKVSPALAFVGNSVASESIRKHLLPYLEQRSISHQVTPSPDNDSSIHSYIIHGDDVGEVEHRINEVFRLERASDSMSRTHLSSTIAEFEFFVVRLAQIFAKRHPKKFINGGETVTLNDIISAQSLESIISDKVDKKIRDELHGSHEKIIEWLVSTLELGDISPILKSDIYKDFMEACQRRHILAHNGGMVNAQYREKCAAVGFAPERLTAIGQKVQISPSYLRRVSGRTFLLGLYILHMAIQKIGEQERIASLESLLNASHDFLIDGQTKMATRVIDFAENQKKSIHTQLKLSFGINRALAALHNPDKERNAQIIDAKSILNRYDWSVTGPVFDLALACVKRDFDNILLLAKAAASSGLDYNSVSTFMAFSEAKAIQGFMDCFPKRPLLLAEPEERKFSASK